MRVWNCFKPTAVDMATTALAVGAAVTLWVTGNARWLSTTTAILIPLYLAANQLSRRRRQ